MNIEGPTHVRPGQVWRDTIPGLEATVCPEMVTISPGIFLMGAETARDAVASDRKWARHARPRHPVRIKQTFALGRYPVTFAQWDAALAAGASIATYDVLNDPHIPSPPDDYGMGRGNRPVINVSWRIVQVYIRWLNVLLGLEGRPDAYRLPSEAEWEYSCRAGSLTAYSWGDEFASKFAANTGKSEPVGSYPANAFGLYDMHGNVWEWCQDEWHENYGGSPTNYHAAPRDGSAWASGVGTNRMIRVLRGGSWKSGSTELRTALRSRQWENQGAFDTGFRVAKTLVL